MPSAYLTFLYEPRIASASRPRQRKLLENIPLPADVKPPRKALVGAYGVREPVVLIHDLYRARSRSPVVPIRVEVRLDAHKVGRIKAEDLETLEVWNLKRFHKDAMQELLATSDMPSELVAPRHLESISTRLDRLTSAARAMSSRAKLLVTSVWNGERRMDIGVLMSSVGVIVPDVDPQIQFVFPSWLASN